MGWKQLSTGDLCRKHIQEQTEIGKEIDFAIKSGKLVSDELITQMVVSWFKQQDHSAPVIFDGFPRTVAQAQALESLIEQSNASLKLHVVVLDLNDEIIIKRLGNRFICQNKSCQAVYSLADKALSPKNYMVCDECEAPIDRRKDDEPEAVKERLKIYHAHMSALLKFYDQTGKEIYRIPVDKSLDQVFNMFKGVAQGFA